MSGLGLVSGLRQRICLLCYVNSASIFSLTCLPSTHFYNIKIFPDPVKMESELSKNLEFPDGKYLYLMMGPSLHTTENCYFGFSKFYLGILIRQMESWDLLPFFANDIRNVAWAICLHHCFSKYNKMVQDKMVSNIIIDAITESIGSL